MNNRNKNIKNDMEYILGNLKNGRSIKFIYAPKNIYQHNKADFIKHPLYGYYNNFYLTQRKNELYFENENGEYYEINNPEEALDLFYKYYNDPTFSTMVALVDDKKQKNIIFYNSDNGDFFPTYY
jgi:hypothetical protein